MERTKAPFVKPEVTSGPGIPKYFWPLFERKEQLEKELKKGISEFSEFSMKLNLEEYDFHDESMVDPNRKDLTLDVTALDLYNDDVRRYRKAIVHECRQLHHMAAFDGKSLLALSKAIVRIGRVTFYGTVKSQTLAEEILPLFMWLLNRKHFPDSFIITIIRSISEMCWTSLRLKAKLVEVYGVKILYRNMRFLPSNKRLATWACYALTMASTGSSEVIVAMKELPGIEELVAELSFEMYWYDWPANFGMILQAILYGPQSVTASSESFEFL